MDIVKVSQTLSLIIQCATIITLVYTLIRFAGRPQVKQDDRLTALEEWKKEVDRRLNNGNVHFDEIDKGNKVTQEAILALLEHEIDHNNTAKLIEAKDKLHSYLINK